MDSIRQNGKPPITSGDGIQVLEIIDVVFESSRRGGAGAVG